MAELFIASDDFTGALDTGVKLSRQGISARVVCDLSRIVPCPEKIGRASCRERV